MDKQQLRSLIENLHHELASAEAIDADSRALLKQLVQDVENLADESSSSEAAQPDTAGQLENAALQFESEHPKLSMAVGEVVDALSRMGI
ncbi:MAG: DUF4404 family protein [Gammaproteobacteria bacterium]|nr:DUF4404 family protein [Gammaproteobacteria bacterium]